MKQKKKMFSVVGFLIALFGLLALPGTSNAATTISTGASNIAQVTISPDGSTLYGLDGHGNIYPINTASKTVGSAISTGASDPGNLVISPDGSTLYLSDGSSGNVYPINTTSKTVGSAISTGKSYISPSSHLSKWKHSLWD